MTRYRHCLFILVFSPAWLLAQDCNYSINATTPGYRFVINDDGTATDLYTSLRWQRCPIGYQLYNKGNIVASDDECELQQTANFNWPGALQSAVDLNDNGGSAGFTDWRVPNIKELASIVEYQCIYPASNLAVFPFVAYEKFWSSTYKGTGAAELVDFKFGDIYWSYKDIEGFQNHVRLVRGGI